MRRRRARLHRFYTRFAGALDAHYMDSELSLAEARLLYEIANREAPLAAELQAELGLDAGYVSRILRRFQAEGWIARRPGRGRAAPADQPDRAGRAFSRRSMRAPAPRSAERIEGLARATATRWSRRWRRHRLLSGGDAPWHIRTFRTGDLATIAARQSILYEPYGWKRPMEDPPGRGHHRLPPRLQARPRAMLGRRARRDDGRRDPAGRRRRQCRPAPPAPRRALGARPWHRQRAGRRMRRASRARPATTRSACGPTPCSTPRGASTKPPASASSRPRSITNSASPSRARPGSWRSEAEPLSAAHDRALRLHHRRHGRQGPDGHDRDAPRRDPHAGLHAGRHRGDGQGDEAGGRARDRRRHHPRQHLSSDAPPRRRADRAARRAARFHGLGAADPHRQRRLSGDEPRPNWPSSARRASPSEPSRRQPAHADPRAVDGDPGPARLGHRHGLRPTGDDDREPRGAGGGDGALDALGGRSRDGLRRARQRRAVRHPAGRARRGAAPGLGRRADRRSASTAMRSAGWRWARGRRRCSPASISRPASCPRTSRAI